MVQDIDKVELLACNKIHKLDLIKSPQKSAKVCYLLE